MNYKDVINLGFKEEIVSDNVYYNIHGFNYCIISLNLDRTGALTLYWRKEDKQFEFFRCTKKGNILHKKELKDKEALFLIDLFIDKKNKND